MTDLLYTEKDLVTSLKDYIKAEENKLERLKQWVTHSHFIFWFCAFGIDSARLCLKPVKDISGGAAEHFKQHSAQSYSTAMNNNVLEMGTLYGAFNIVTVASRHSPSLCPSGGLTSWIHCLPQPRRTPRASWGTLSMRSNWWRGWTQNGETWRASYSVTLQMVWRCRQAYCIQCSLV